MTLYIVEQICAHGGGRGGDIRPRGQLLRIDAREKCVIDVSRRSMLDTMHISVGAPHNVVGRCVTSLLRAETASPSQPVYIYEVCRLDTSVQIERNARAASQSGASACIFRILLAKEGGEGWHDGRQRVSAF